MLGKFGCPICNGTGVIIGEFGVETECQCVRENIDAERDGAKNISVKKLEAPNIFGELAVEDKIRKMQLIKDYRINDNFDTNHVKCVAVQMCAIMKCKMKPDDVNNYLELLSQILTTLRARELPKKSYLIGADNGFGKTTFANTAIKIMAANGMKAVPYISLTELAEKWADANDKLARRIENKNVALDKKGDELSDDPDSYQCEYDWHDYVNADLAIVYLTSTNEETMWIEMQTLKQLLTLRGGKGKPTIVMLSSSLDWYRNSERIRKYALLNILETQPNAASREKQEYGKNEAAYKVIENRYDKLEYLSVYLIPLNS